MFLIKSRSIVSIYKNDILSIIVNVSNLFRNTLHKENLYTSFFQYVCTQEVHMVGIIMLLLSAF